MFPNFGKRLKRDVTTLVDSRIRSNLMSLGMAVRCFVFFCVFCVFLLPFIPALPLDDDATAPAHSLAPPPLSRR